MIPKRRAFFDWSELSQDLPPLKEVHEHVVLGELTGRLYVPNGMGVADGEPLAAQELQRILAWMRALPASAFQLASRKLCR
jgi:hypothetical protein